MVIDNLAIDSRVSIRVLASAVFFPLLAIAQNGHVVARTEFASGSQDFRAEEITYLGDGLRIKGYLLTPTKEEKHPCIIFNRGGNPQLNSLSRESVVRGHAAILASAGYMIVASHYRQGGRQRGARRDGR